MKEISRRGIDELEAGFNVLFHSQYELQMEAYNTTPDDLNDEDRAEFIRWNAYALINELVEATNEVGWKPWATARHVNTEEFTNEMVDLLHFFANLCLATGVTGEMIAKGYAAKRQRNLERQQEGYTGNDKCPYCGRDYLEGTCAPSENILNGEGEIIRQTKPWCPFKTVSREVPLGPDHFMDVDTGRSPSDDWD